TSKVLIAIGCNAYDTLGSLGGAEKDAQVVYKLLVDGSVGGHDHTASKLLLSPKLAEIREALTEILFGASVPHSFTFFFAGHGGVKDGTYYLCPRDTNTQRLSTSALPLSQLLAIIGEAKPRHTNVIIDACQAGAVNLNLQSILRPEIVG